MIIFGTKAKSKDLDHGQFYCPHCRAARPYVRKEARPYFTLYFIPIFPVGKGGEYVECQACGMAFAPDVLRAEPPQSKPDLASMLNNIQAMLADGQPVEYIIRDLTALGLDWDVARNAVETQLGTERKTCEACGLAYSAAVKTCAACHQPLPERAG